MPGFQLSDRLYLNEIQWSGRMGGRRGFSLPFGTPPCAALGICWAFPLKLLVIFENVGAILLMHSMFHPIPCLPCCTANPPYRGQSRKPIFRMFEPHIHAHAGANTQAPAYPRITTIIQGKTSTDVWGLAYDPGQNALFYSRTDTGDIRMYDLDSGKERRVAGKAAALHQALSLDSQILLGLCHP
eukprot:1138640-Pelagomonas_calceolata.AAC.7